MKKKIFLAASAIALTAGSIMALSNTGDPKPVAKAATEQCPPECCNGDGGECGPEQCRE